MTSAGNFRLRVRYRKGGRLAMLSHLELTHALERIVRRSSLPFALSQGFSPHMKLSFGSALPVGVGSTCEVFDITLTEYVPANKALLALSEASPYDLMCHEAFYVEPRAKAASVAFPYSVYRVILKDYVDSVDVPASIEVVRKKKLKVLDVSDFLVGGIRICPHSDDADAMQCLPAGETDTNQVCSPISSLIFQLKSGPEGNLRPDVLLKNIEADCEGGRQSLNAVSITRIHQAEEPVNLDGFLK